MGYGKRHMGKMVKSEQWVATEVKTPTSAKRKCEECEDHIQKCEFEIQQIEIRKRTWAKRLRLIQKLQEEQGWGSGDKTKKIPKDNVAKKAD